jgi:hypothetical protein
MRKGLTPEEDAELRRLNALAEYGMLTPTMKARYAELRAQDRRQGVRAPQDTVSKPGANK